MNSIAKNTRLEKAAHDSGFDIEKPISGSWLSFASSHCPLNIWLKSGDADEILVGLSSHDVANEFLSLGKPVAADTTIGANSVWAVKDLAALYTLLKRAFQLARSLPDEPLKAFRKQTQGLPQSTEVERTVILRVGQEIFRERLFEFWDGKCAVTGLAIPALLKASHIKPWSECASDAERLDVFNGLLLAPHIDAAFDRGFVTFGDDGSLIVSKSLGHEGLRILGIDAASTCAGLTDAHQKYLAWHRTNEFQGK